MLHVGLFLADINLEPTDFGGKPAKKRISTKSLKKGLAISSISTLGIGGSCFLGKKLLNKKNQTNTTEQNESKIVDDSKYIDNAQKMFVIYSKGYSPSKISLDWMSDPKLAGNFLFENAARETTAYVVDKEERTDLVMQLLTEREPVNIGMSRSYDLGQLLKHFGYDVSAYSKLGGAQFLPPNLAVYCYTPIWINTDFDSSLGDFVAFAHVINMIGLAFDSFDQVDYQYFKAQEKPVLLENMRNMFVKSFQCAIDKKLSKIFIAGIGCSAFATYYSSLHQGNGNFTREIFYPALQLALDDWASHLAANGIDEIISFGDIDVGSNVQMKVCDKISLKSLSGNSYRVPDIFSTLKTEGYDLNRCLFFNAWDPHSMIGNGNFCDYSLDGFFGQASAMAWLGWPLSNPWFTAEKIRWVNPLPVEYN